MSLTVLKKLETFGQVGIHSQTRVREMVMIVWAGTTTAEWGADPTSGG